MHCSDGVRRSILISAIFVALVGCARDEREDVADPTDVVPLPEAVFPLEIGSDGRTLVDQRGTPFLLHGDAGWSLISETRRDDVETYLVDRKARGFNAVVVVLIDHVDPLQNAHGDPPFTAPGNFATPNEAYFAHADYVVTRAAQLGFLVWLSPIYLGWGGGEEGFYQDAIAAGPEQMRAWGRWVGQRYAHVDGLVWLMGGDYVPPEEGLTLLEEVVAGIREQDDRHLFAAHWSRENSGWQVDVSWIDVNTTYTRPPVYVKALADREGMHAPLVLLEGIYENEHGITTARLRAQAYHAMLSGSVGHFFGSWPVWKFADGWQEGLASPGARSMTHLRNLFATLPWWALEPDTGASLFTGGRGTYGNEDYATLARDASGTSAVIHLPSSRELEFDLSTMQGPVRARWYDPAHGIFSDAAPGRFPQESGQRVAAPGRNGAGDQDWILVLEVTQD